MKVCALRGVFECISYSSLDSISERHCGLALCFPEQFFTQICPKEVLKDLLNPGL